MSTGPQLVIFTGLPGTGKSTLADEAALGRSGIGADTGSGCAAIALLTTLAREQ